MAVQTHRPTNETKNVEAWREQALLHAGYPPAEAYELAHNHTIDLHQAINLLKHHCPLDLALQILR